MVGSVQDAVPTRISPPPGARIGSDAGSTAAAPPPPPPRRATSTPGSCAAMPAACSCSTPFKIVRMRIGVLTGGGDAPGLNAAIRAVARRAFTLNLKVSGIKNGWAGLLGEGEIEDL